MLIYNWIIQSRVLSQQEQRKEDERPPSKKRKYIDPQWLDDTQKLNLLTKGILSVDMIFLVSPFGCISRILVVDIFCSYTSKQQAIPY